MQIFGARVLLRGCIVLLIVSSCGRDSGNTNSDASPDGQYPDLLTIRDVLREQWSESKESDLDGPNRDAGVVQAEKDVGVVFETMASDLGSEHTDALAIATRPDGALSDLPLDVPADSYIAPPDMALNFDSAISDVLSSMHPDGALSDLPLDVPADSYIAPPDMGLYLDSAASDALGSFTDVGLIPGSWCTSSVPIHSLCGTRVVEFVSDHDNCGDCGVLCGEGFCAAGRCVDPQWAIVTTANNPARIVVDNTSLYWTEPATGRIGRADKSVGGTSYIATEQQQPMRLVVDATHVYWTNRTGNVVMRILKSGGSPEQFATALQPRVMTADEEYIYWMNDADLTIWRSNKATGVSSIVGVTDPLHVVGASSQELLLYGDYLYYDRYQCRSVSA